MKKDIRYLVKLAGMTYEQVIKELEPMCREARWQVPAVPNISQYLSGKKGDPTDDNGKAAFIRRSVEEIVKRRLGDTSIWH